MTDEIVIIAQAPAYNYDNTFEVWESRKVPVCPSCCTELEFINKDGDKDDRYTELWYCLHCGYDGWFIPGDYGDIERVLTEAEWLEREAVRRTRRYLKRRYGDNQPTSIRDYWSR